MLGHGRPNVGMVVLYLGQREIFCLGKLGGPSGRKVAGVQVAGNLLGFGLITKYALSKNEAAMEKGQAIRAKLSKFQGPLGIVAIVVAAYILIANIFHIAI